MAGRFDVDHYLRRQGDKLVARFDAASYVSLMRAMDLHDVGDWAAAGRETAARVGTVIGVGAVIQGWDEGIPGQKVGSRFQLDVPAAMAYGDQQGDGGEVESALAGGVGGEDHVVRDGGRRHRYLELVGEAKHQPEVFLHQGEGECRREVRALGDRRRLGGDHRRRGRRCAGRARATA